MSTFDGSSTTRVWARKLDAFFLLHPVVEREVVEITVLHLEGEANTWWFNHLSHARVSTLVEFSQILIRIFGKGEEKLSPPVEEACTSVVVPMEEKPSYSVV